MEENRTHDYIFKVVLIGDTKTGKTNIFTQFLRNEFDRNTKPTIGIDFGNKHLTIKDNKVIKTQVWDSAGEKRFRSISATYYKSASGVILVYDITNQESFEHVKEWLKEVRNHSNSDCLIMLVGNKADLEDKRKVKKEHALEYAQSEGLQFIEVSAKDYNNIEEMFLLLVNRIYEEFYVKEKEKPLSSTETKE